MKVSIPEIAWHSREAIHTVDFCLPSVLRNENNQLIYRVATASIDSTVFLWDLILNVDGVTCSDVEFISSLRRHQHTVNVVRFSPKGDALASGDVQGGLFIWRKADQVLQGAPDLWSEDDDMDIKEQWVVSKTLKGHLEDICDLCWSPDGSKLVSVGMEDKAVIVWSIEDGKSLMRVKDHKYKRYPQSVCWDPLGKYIITVSPERTMFVYDAKTLQRLHSVSKATIDNGTLKSVNDKAPVVRLFHDDSSLAYFRRASFSPDGNLFMVPVACIDYDQKMINCTLLFSRNSLQKPCAWFPCGDHVSLAVRFCPSRFTLRSDGVEPYVALKYRMVFAIITKDAVYLHDTQQRAPFSYVKNLHYASMTDVAWSSDGRLLVISSVDGYCSIITFAENELGTFYDDPDDDQMDNASSTYSSSPSPETNALNNDSQRPEVANDCNNGEIKQPRRIALQIVRPKSDDQNMNNTSLPYSTPDTNALNNDARHQIDNSCDTSEKKQPRRVALQLVKPSQ